MEVRLSPSARASMKSYQENTKFGDLENGDIFYMPNLDDHAYMKINTTADKRNILDLTQPSYWQAGDIMPVVKREIIMLVGFEGEEK